MTKQIEIYCPEIYNLLELEKAYKTKKCPLCRYKSEEGIIVFYDGIPMLSTDHVFHTHTTHAIAMIMPLIGHLIFKKSEDAKYWIRVNTDLLRKVGIR